MTGQGRGAGQLDIGKSSEGMPDGGVELKLNSPEIATVAPLNVAGVFWNW